MMSNENDFSVHVRALHDGRVTFNDFARSTRAHWERLALYIARRWRTPEWFAPADIVQELLLGAWLAVWKWDPARGGGAASLAKYVVWNAVDKAKKKAHKARGAVLSGNADASPGRALLERPISARERPDDWLDVMHNAPPEQHERVEQRERYAALEAVCDSQRQRVALAALAVSGSLADAAVMLYEDPAARCAARISSPKQAAATVVETAYAVAERIGIAAA